VQAHKRLKNGWRLLSVTPVGRVKEIVGVVGASVSPAFAIVSLIPPCGSVELPSGGAGGRLVGSWVNSEVQRTSAAAGSANALAHAAIATAIATSSSRKPWAGVRFSEVIELSIVGVRFPFSGPLIA
jgi:hypothetical protein